MHAPLRWLEQYSTVPLYNTKSVVSETGVPADTFRAWERRYGTPNPARTAGGQRLYSERDILTIRWLRDRTGDGLTISQAIALLRSEEHTTSTAVRSLDAIREELLAALLRYDATGADTLLSEAFALHPFETVCLDVIQVTLQTVGTLWHQQQATIAQEHFVSQFMRRKLMALLNVFSVAEGRATVLAACTSGEFHDFGLLLLALFLIRRNYRMVYLGADVPVADIIHTAEQLQPAIVCLSSTTTNSTGATLETARLLRELHPSSLIYVGGHGIPPSTSLEGVHVLNTDASMSADAINTGLMQLRQL